MRAALAALLLAALLTPTAHAATGPVFRDGEAQPVFDPGDVVRDHVRVPVATDGDRDGRPDEVHLTVVRPRATERGARLPAVLEFGPYWGGVAEVTPHAVDVELHVPGVGAHRPPRPVGPGGATPPDYTWPYEGYLLARGHVVVYGHSPGTGRSTGCPSTGGPDEVAAARAAVRWLAGRGTARDAEGRPVTATWSSGRVAMAGMSYDGTLANATAATGEPALSAVVSVGAISSWYDYYRSAGLVVAPHGYQGEDADVHAELVRSRAEPQRCAEALRRMQAEQDRVTGDANGFWARRDYRASADRVRAPVLIAHGLNDLNVRASQAARWYELLRERGVPTRLWWHEGGHDDPADLHRDAWLREVNRWLTRYLHGVPNGVEAEPRSTVRRADGRVTAEADWPAPAARPVVLRPSPGGAGRGGLSAVEHVGREALVDDASRTAQSSVEDDAAPNRLSYLTEPLPRDTRLSGIARAELVLSIDRPAANVTVVLADHAPDGSVRVISRGWADPHNRHRVDRTEPVAPGRPFRLDVELTAQDHVLPAGHRLGVAVLSSDHEHTLRPRPGTTLALDLRGTRFAVPLST